MKVRLTNIDTVTDYLRSKGITFTPGRVTTAKCPWDGNCTCYKFNAKLTSYTGNVVRAYMYGSVNGYLKNTPESAWQLIYCYFSDALTYIEHEDINDFVRAYGYESIKEARKVYNSCKKIWEGLISLGLSYDDIVAIASRAMDGEDC